jgi:hypothetical protein
MCFVLHGNELLGFAFTICFLVGGIAPTPPFVAWGMWMSAMNGIWSRWFLLSCCKYRRPIVVTRCCFVDPYSRSMGKIFSLWQFFSFLLAKGKDTRIIAVKLGYTNSFVNQICSSSHSFFKPPLIFHYSFTISFIIQQNLFYLIFQWFNSINSPFVPHHRTQNEY